MNDDKTNELPVTGTPLRGHRRLIIIIMTIVAAALVATGAVIAVINDLSREVVDNGLGASAPPATSTPTPGPTATPTETPGSEDDAPARPEATPEPTTPWQAPPVSDPVDLDSPAEFTASVRAEVTKIEAVEGEARGPGEIGGPALRVSVTLNNDTDKAVSLDTTVVALFYGAGQTPGVELSGPGTSPFHGSLPAGGTASGVYVFTCPPGERDDIRITVSYSPSDTTVAFEGAAA